MGIKEIVILLAVMGVGYYLGKNNALGMLTG